MNGYKGRAEFIEKLNRLVDENHHYLYLIDGVFEGVRSIEKSIHTFHKEPTKDIPGFEGTLDALKARQPNNMHLLNVMHLLQKKNN